MSRWGTGTSCWGIDTSCLAGRGLSVPALQLLHPSPTEGLDPDAPRATHALPRGAPHHQRHPLHRSLLRRSLTGQDRPPQTFSSWSTTTAQQPPVPRAQGTGSSFQALDLSLPLSHLGRDGAAGQRQSTALWLGPSWRSGCLPGKNCSLSLLCSNWSFLTHLPEKPSPSSSASSRGQCLSTTGADPAAQRDSRGEKSHPRASPQQSCSLGAFCFRVYTETWVRLKSPRDLGTAAAPSFLAPVMGAERCPLEMVTQKTSWETGSAWIYLTFAGGGAEWRVVCPHTALRHPVLDASGERDRQKQCSY